MVRWWARALILIAMAHLGAASAQDREQIDALKNRVLVDPERPFDDPFENPDPDIVVAAVPYLVGPIGMPRMTLGFEIAANDVHQLIAQSFYDKALASYEQILRDDDDVKLTSPKDTDIFGSGLTSRDFHALVQERLRRLPPSVLAKYRKQNDAEAARLLADGTRNRNPVPLRKLVRDYRASSHADRALGLLGDFDFERGDFDKALDWWRQIAPLPSRQLLNRAAGEMRPSDDDLPRIHAKQTLALLFAGRPDAGRECDAYRALFPDERGTLAGKTDRYHAILTHWRTELSRVPSLDADESWPTFAGSVSRNRILRKAPSPRLWLDGAAWRVPLPKLDAKEPPPVWMSATRSLAVPHSAFHPVVADGQVLISDGGSVHSFDLLTGKPRFSMPPGRGAIIEEESPSGSSFSVSTAPGRVFARLGKHPGNPRPRTLVCLDTSHDGKALWSTRADAGHFDTDPLVVGDRVYVGSVSRDENWSTRTLHCFDLAGAPQWQTKLAEIRELLGDKPPRHGLLVAAGGLIVDAMPSGGVVAVDAWTGRRAWAFRSPTLEAPSPRGASSCLAADGRIYLAPADSQSVFCLDAETGRTVWERLWIKGPSDVIVGPPRVSEIVDLLGVVDDRLIFTDRYHLQALDARTGGKLDWQQPAMGKLPSHGRGLLAGSWVFWPTADPEVSWRAVTQMQGALRLDGEPGASATGGDGIPRRGVAREAGADRGILAPPVADAPGSPTLEPEYYEPTILRGLPPGNVVFGNGCLIVAGPRELVVYVPAARQLPELEADPEAKNAPAKLFRLAMAQLDAGQSDRAQSTFAKIEQQAPRAELDAWKNLIRERTSSPVSRPAMTSPQPNDRDRPMPDPSIRPPAAKAPAAKLEAAWGPIRGAAPPIERAGRDDDIVVVLDGPDVAFLSSATGVEQFRRPRRVNAIHWIGRNGSEAILAGPDGLDAFDVDFRRPTWRFDAPAQAAAHWRLVNDRPMRVAGSPRLDGFQFVDGCVTFFEGRRRVFVLDSKSGATLSETWSNPVDALIGGESLPPPLDWNLVNRPPVPLPNLDDPEDVDLTEARRRIAGRLQGSTHGAVSLRSETTKRWTYTPPARIDLTGAAAHLLGDATACFALIPRNQGYELIRFERDWLDVGYRQKWALPAIELRDGFDVLAATSDDKALYFASAGQVQARSTADGSLLWTRELPPIPGAWKVVPFAGGLIAWPQTHAGLPALSGPVDPFTAAVTLLHGRRGIGSVPILFLDPKDGAVKQRLDVPHDRGPVFVNVAGVRLIVTAGGAVRAWSATP